jgi:hypothetical protein
MEIYLWAAAIYYISNVNKNMLSSGGKPAREGFKRLFFLERTKLGGGKGAGAGQALSYKRSACGAHRVPL